MGVVALRSRGFCSRRRRARERSQPASGEQAITSLYLWAWPARSSITQLHTDSQTSLTLAVSRPKGLATRRLEQTAHTHLACSHHPPAQPKCCSGERRRPRRRMPRQQQQQQYRPACRLGRSGGQQQQQEQCRCCRRRRRRCRSCRRRAQQQPPSPGYDLRGPVGAAAAAAAGQR